MTIARKALVSFAVALLASAAAQSAYAGLLIDRGLPTANLNNVSGANRSNVSWAFGADTSGNIWVVGDTFTNTKTFNYHIDTIRVWTTGSYDPASLKLLGGLDGSASFGTLSTSVVAAPTTYAGGAGYQTTSGGTSPITQLDFAVSGLTLAPGQTYDFFVAGMQGSTPYVFTHASNAAKSGSPQDGADDMMLAGILSGGSVSSVETWTSAGNGWDKPSDLNVQVFGTVPDAGSTVLLLGFALTGLGLIRRRLAA